MKNSICRKTFRSLATVALTLAIGSCDGKNVEEPTEVSCNTASGLWTITSANCNGSPAENLKQVFLLFGQTRTIAQTTGAPECATTFTWDYALGEDSPSLNMNGKGKLSCSANGESTASCSVSANSCNSQIDITGIANNYSTCVITDGTMIFTRAVNPINNPDGLSYCQNGQEEIVNLIKASDIDLSPPPDPNSTLASLTVTGPNPIDFGTVSVGRDRTITITITNQGKTNATALTVVGLRNPFAFKGGSYPGTGGTCSTSLAPQGSCTLTVLYKPTAVGTHNKVIQIKYFDSKSNQILNHGLTGKGSQSLAILNFSNGPFYDYGTVNVNASKTHVFTITNAGGGSASALTPAATTAPFQYLGGLYPGTSGTCGVTLNANASCTIAIEFAPTTDGNFNNNIKLNYNDGSLPQTASRNVFGLAVP